jgi:hypothetical protein
MVCNTSLLGKLIAKWDAFLRLFEKEDKIVDDDSVENNEKIVVRDGKNGEYKLFVGAKFIGAGDSEFTLRELEQCAKNNDITRYIVEDEDGKGIMANRFPYRGSVKIVNVKIATTDEGARKILDANNDCIVIREEIPINSGE